MTKSAQWFLSLEMTTYKFLWLDYLKYMFLFALKLLFQAFLLQYLLSYHTDACINTCRSLCMKCSLPLSSFFEK